MNFRKLKKCFVEHFLVVHLRPFWEWKGHLRSSKPFLAISVMDWKNSKILHLNIFSKIENQSIFYEIILIAYRNRFHRVQLRLTDDQQTKDLRTVDVVIFKYSTDVLKYDNLQKESSISRILMTPFPLKRAFGPLI